MRFIHTLMQMLLKPCALTGKLVMDVDLTTFYNILPDKDVQVSEGASEHLGKLNKEFYSNVKSFLTTAIHYMLKLGKLSENLSSACQSG